MTATDNVLKAAKKLDIFFVFLDSIIPPNRGEGAREALYMLHSAVFNLDIENDRDN